jgi:hypothetical protein
MSGGSSRKTPTKCLKEGKMLYKTIVLHLLEDRPQMYQQLRKSRTLLATLNRLAEELKASHEALMNLGNQPNEAAELAIKELVDSLPPASENGE